MVTAPRQLNSGFRHPIPPKMPAPSFSELPKLQPSATIMTDGQSLQTVPKRSGLLKFMPVALLVLALGSVFLFGFDTYVSIENLSSHRNQLLQWRNDHALLAAVIFLAAYAIAIAISLPAAALLTVIGGFLFGTFYGGALVVVGATIGATAVCVAAKYAFAALFRDKAGPWVTRMEDGFNKNALSYLLVLRLIPLFPFWLVNIVPGVLGISIPIFVLGTFFGIIPGSLVFASLGGGIGHILDRGGEFDFGLIWNAEILVPLILLAVLALIPAIYRHFKGPNLTHKLADND
jgi:uncharacterized membrane protein YdjX (TVP38/TMEM64 family)